MLGRIALKSKMIKEFKWQGPEWLTQLEVTEKPTAALLDTEEERRCVHVRV